MHLVRIQKRPYAVVNGKDFAVYRWFEAGRHGPLFLQVAGRTPLHREDLPSDDWIVLQTRAGTTRVSTAWRKPWFDCKVDATRKLAFLGASTEGSFYLALRYIARRFGVVTAEPTLATRSAVLAEHLDGPYTYMFEAVADTGLTESALVLLEIPSHLDAEAASTLLAVPLSL